MAHHWRRLDPGLGGIRDLRIDRLDSISFGAADLDVSHNRSTLGTWHGASLAQKDAGCSERTAGN